MENKQASEKIHAAAGSAVQSEQEECESVRVNDRRRVFFDDETGDDARASQIPDADTQAHLKTPQVEELEARGREAEERARAADQKVLDVQSRFDQERAKLERETSELRGRLNRQADERALREKTAFVNALLPSLDNLQLAVQAAEQGGTIENLLDGLRGTIASFENALRSIGVESVEAKGAQFDPELHEAVDTAEVEMEDDGIITQEYGRGYRLGNQLLRPARVQVGRAKA